MTRINLLPWREIRRKEQDRQFLSISAGACILMGLVVFYAHWHMDTVIDYQEGRNRYLQEQIKAVEDSIREIEDIRQKREELIARMDVIRQLQRDRTQIVHVFDDLVRKLPKGVYFTGMSKNGTRMALEGYAQSNARISALMRNLDSSEWFVEPELDVINVTQQGGSRVSKFTLRVTQANRSREAEQSSGADARTSG